MTVGRMNLFGNKIAQWLTCGIINALVTLFAAAFIRVKSIKNKSLKT